MIEFLVLLKNKFLSECDKIDFPWYVAVFILQTPVEWSRYSDFDINGIKQPRTIQISVMYLEPLRKLRVINQYKYSNITIATGLKQFVRL